MSNPETTLTLDECVAEVLGLLTGLDLTYDPNQDRYRAIARCLNRALRSNALEREWSYYSSVENVGVAQAGQIRIALGPTVRPRIINDDAVRLMYPNSEMIAVWAYFIPRDALHKYRYQKGLWCSVIRDSLEFSRPFYEAEDGLDIRLPVMREPEMFVIPPFPQSSSDPLPDLPDSTRNQELDFVYPDVITLRAGMYYAMTDPVMQPRVQTLEAQYKDLMYQIIERDERNTDTPYQNPWDLGITGSIEGSSVTHYHPHSG